MDHSDTVRMPKQSLLSAERTRPQNTMLVLEMTRSHEMVIRVRVRVRLHRGGPGWCGVDVRK